MKTRKIHLLVILLAGLMLPTLESCKKYPDGPFISFRSRTERVSHAWKVGSYTLNGTDLTGTMNTYVETYTKDGNYSYSWYILGGTSKWSFQNKDKEIQLNGVSSHSARTLTILKLEDTAFWYYYMDGNNNRNEFHMVRV